MCCRVFFSISGFCPLDAYGTRTLLGLITETVSRRCQMSLGEGSQW